MRQCIREDTCLVTLGHPLTANVSITWKSQQSSWKPSLSSPHGQCYGEVTTCLKSIQTLHVLLTIPPPRPSLLLSPILTIQHSMPSFIFQVDFFLSPCHQFLLQIIKICHPFEWWLRTEVRFLYSNFLLARLIEHVIKLDTKYWASHSVVLWMHWQIRSSPRGRTNKISQALMFSLALC